LHLLFADALIDNEKQPAVPCFSLIALFYNIHTKSLLEGVLGCAKWALPFSHVSILFGLSADSGFAFGTSWKFALL